MENYECKCGLKFDTLAEIQAHWADPKRDMTKPHYRGGMTRDGRKA